MTERRRTAKSEYALSPTVQFINTDGVSSNGEMLYRHFLPQSIFLEFDNGLRLLEAEARGECDQIPWFSERNRSDALVKFARAVEEGRISAQRALPIVRYIAATPCLGDLGDDHPEDFDPQPREQPSDAS